MNTAPDIRRRVGMLAFGMMVLVECFWAFWGAAELYYEAWGLPFPEPLFYLIPFLITLTLTLAALKWPRAGGRVIIFLGAVFTIFVMGPRISSGSLTLAGFLSWFPLTFLLLLLGGMIIWGGPEAFQRLPESHLHPFWRRSWRYTLAIGLPALIVVGSSVRMLPVVLTRLDDGNREARLIEGNGVELIWSPAGPGWNWRQPGGGYPSWEDLAWYGVPPVGIKTDDHLPAGSATQEDMARTGLCRYLDSAGLELMDQPQDIWRMPTTDEIVRSLNLHGENAGCAWEGELGEVPCALEPDKETPLWAPNQSPIYMWSGDEYDDDDAFYVSYNGRVQGQPKYWGNPRHGYRCVREIE